MVITRIQLWGDTVGAMYFDEQRGCCIFEYTPSWIAKGIEISPLRLPLAPTLYQFPQLSEATYKGMPGAFADTLPDDFGNAVINAWLARQGRDPASFSALERLLYTGKRGMGALEYEPETARLDQSTEIDLTSLTRMAQAVVDQRRGLSEQLSDSQQRSDQAMQSILQVGTSAGGARAKAVIGINQDRTEVRSGQVDLPPGFEHYLLKFDGVVEHSRSQETFGDPQGYGRMEYAYYLMARDCGIEMMPCELLEEGERAHFLTKRFDRVGNQKIHYQSLCAMDHADYKQPGHYSYEQLFGVMRALRLKRNEALQQYRRMVFNIVARNHDDHTKNFGFVLKPGGAWQLAPAFDVAYSYKPGSPWVNSHQLTLNGKRDHFDRHDLLAPAESFRKQALQIIEQVQDVVADWATYAAKAQVPESLTEEIKAAHRLGF
ncbi:type II toxin-antitoxin system HipA family toxin [Motiliproteus coralliicola]|uniref:Type II toxin-antitoxin system HipA family toxin n=1 Tax=Motiliproteus coralliicola TaxID=2283196 RepID=A0A369WU02_9GAMM|nr:type II toxin-antitoxin system HipA family toxin [Motiliproteus coralliicola]RDE24613.1 type II toxin-antitoxin system HipA family toxin [Motiliproteus coralliicola]